MFQRFNYERALIVVCCTNINDTQLRNTKSFNAFNFLHNTGNVNRNSFETL